MAAPGEGPQVLPALAMAAEEQCLLKKVLVEQALGSHVVEVTFPAPVVLTSARIGAGPTSSAAQQQRTQLLLFAQDAGAPAAARFLQLCPGFEQPQSGTRVVQLQPCVTTRVLLRGCFQTVPLSLFGYSLEAAAAAAPPPQERRITLPDALQWLHQQQQGPAGGSGEGPLPPAAAAAAGALPQPAVEAALAQLVAYWQQVGTSEQQMAAHPPPTVVFRAAAAVADALCMQLVDGSFGRQPLPADAAQLTAAAAAAAASEQQQRSGPSESRQHPQQGEPAQARDEEPGAEPASDGDAAMPDAEPQEGSPQLQQPPPQEGSLQQPQQQPKAGSPQQGSPQQQAQPQAGQQEQPEIPPQPALAAEQQPPQPMAVQQPLLSGEALLDAAADMVFGWCGMLGAGGAGRTASAMRCSAAGLAAAVMLCSCGSGARLAVARWGVVLLDDVLTMPAAPPSFVRYATAACLLIARCCGTLGAASLLGLWKPAHGIVWKSRRRHATPGAAAEAAAGGEAPARSEGDEEAAAAAAAAAAAEMQQQLFAEEEEQRDVEEAGAAAERAALQEQWQRERQQEEEDLYGGSEEEDAPGYADAVPHAGEEAEEAAADIEQPPGGDGAGASAAAGPDAALPAAADVPQSSGGAAAADLAPEAPQGDGAAAPGQAAGAADLPAPSSPAAEARDDLYGDLGIPQVDGAADSPPRMGRRRGADPGERWELGADDGHESPAEERSHRRRHKGKKGRERRGKGRDTRRKSKDSRRDKDRSRSRERGSRQGGERSREERKGRDSEAGEERRRREVDEERRQRAAEEEQRRRRQQQREEEERHRRYLEEQRRLEEEQRRVEQEERRRREQRQREEERGRKRGRSPAPAAEARRPGEPEGKQHRTGMPGEGPSGRKQQLQAPAAPLDEAGKWALHEEQLRSRMSSYWSLKERAYVGCSPHVARQVLAKVQPPRLAALSRQLLHLLRAHEAAAAFQDAAQRLVRAHSADERARQPSMATPDASLLVAEAAASLQLLAELLAKPLPAGSSSSSPAAAGDSQRPASPAAATEPAPELLDAVAARNLLPLLAAVLHVPAVHRPLVEAALPPAVAQAQGAVIEAGLAQQLGLGGRALVAVLASSAGGRRLLLGDAGVLEQLLLATDPGCLEAGWQPFGGSEGASLLQHLLMAEAATAQLCSAALDSEAFLVASQTAAALLHECGASGQRALAQALALHAPAAVPRLLLMLRMHCALLRAACGTGAASCPGADGGAAAAQEAQRYEPDFGVLMAAAPACAPAAQLLRALLGATHPGALAHWQQHAAAVQVAAAAELRQLAALPPAAAAVVAGLGPTRSALASIQGAVVAVVAAQQEHGLPSMLAYLAAELPPLVAPGEEGGDEEGDPTPAGPRTVRWAAVQMLFCESDKLACCEQCLRLLASRLWAPGAAGRAAAYTADAAAGLSTLLRAVLAGAELVEASAADDSWQALVGHAIDVGEAAAGRLRALSFLEAAAAAASSLLQHLRGSTCPLKSTSLLAGLLRGHATLCSQEESLACMLGGIGGDVPGAAAAATAAAGSTPGMRCALAARYHLASCLRCYVEAAQTWKPPLLQQVFWGTPAPGLEPGQVAAQTPAQMFATACLLGDLFPPEWPAAGRKATQAPPTDRRYRTALATAIEPCGASFRRLIAAALTSESRLLRAAVVRVLARASGLGGGMGPFLAEPLLEELRTVAESPAPLHDARRLLEVVVPLVYRPAIKSAMLAAPFTSTLAHLLGVVVGKLASADEAGEAAHVCTMAMEAAVVLVNHEVCLNPLAPKEQQQVEDVPPVAEAEPLARALLEQLPAMGGNALIAHRALRLMAAAESGRIALRRAVVAVHAAATGADQPAGIPSAVTVAQAAQWVASRFWGAAERLSAGDAAALAAGGLDSLRSVFADIVNIMQQICVAEDDTPPKPSSAQQRFVAALQAALQAAAAAGLDTSGDEHRWEGPAAADALAGDLVYDPATRMFWRNVRARAATQSQASSAHAMRRFARRDCQAGLGASLATSLHPPLTLPRQPPDQPSIMEQPPAMQPSAAPHAADVDEQQPAMAAGDSTATAGAAAVPSVKEEEAVAAVPQAQNAQHGMDIYADLGAQQVPGQAPQAAAVQPPEPRQQQPSAAGPPPAQGSLAASASGGTEPQQPAPIQQQDAASSGSLQALLSNPAALQALLKDPAQLQQLLQKHPQLISILKSTLGKQGG